MKKGSGLPEPFFIYDYCDNWYLTYYVIYGIIVRSTRDIVLVSDQLGDYKKGVKHHESESDIDFSFALQTPKPN